MVLRLLCHLMLILFISGCSAIGYVKYEEKGDEKRREAITQQEEKENKHIVKEYYLVPDELWFDYPQWRWSFGFYLWEPYWWYPSYSIRCPGCYLFDPFIIKEPRSFERKKKSEISPQRGSAPSITPSDQQKSGDDNINSRNFRR